MKKIVMFPAVLIVCISLCALFPVSVMAETMQVEKSAACENVVNREVVNEGSSFSASVGKIYCYSKVANIDSHTEVVHAWYFGDTQRARVTLNVNPPAWRTYSSKNIQNHEIGSWRVEILDQTGNLLETVRFEVIQ
jgi:hypothetical protein